MILILNNLSPSPLRGEGLRERGRTPVNTHYNQEQGIVGESLAETFLKQNGFKILERRYRTSYGEIDLIAQKKQCLYFVEVKWRKTREFGDPLEAITKGKIKHLTKAAYYFLEKNPQFKKDNDLQLAAIAVREYDEANKIELVLILP